MSIEEEFLLLLLGCAVEQHGIAITPGLPPGLKEILADRSSANCAFKKPPPRLLNYIQQQQTHLALVTDKAKRLEVVASFARIRPYTNQHFVFEVISNQQGAKRDEEFAAAAEQGAGVLGAFHGSPASNWWSILISGLRNFSGAHQIPLASGHPFWSNGAAFGHGIYFSTDFHVANNFSAWKESLFSSPKHFKGSLISVVGLYEVAVTSTTRTHMTDSSVPPTYVIVQNPSHVRLRYLIVFCAAPSLKLSWEAFGALVSLRAVFIAFAVFFTVAAWRIVAHGWRIK